VAYDVPGGRLQRSTRVAGFEANRVRREDLHSDDLDDPVPGLVRALLATTPRPAARLGDA
jgi:hypothetical protein